MTGPEHFAEVEAILELMKEPGGSEEHYYLLAKVAEVHAKLAQVAATITIGTGLDTLPLRVRQDWGKVLYGSR